ncbi:hypothetical protein, conserved [Eimeria praecox]|uniref:Uncharacterized protein n=1 Tax=Eimeria praecox TaxID=51316 RepID=U6G7W2_9EIME|nr:hypothetical protein, conserved [Eimeria praecox]
MEGSGDNRQNLQPIKKEPLRIRSFSSMQQHEQQQMAAAALRIPRGPGSFMPSLQPQRDPRLMQQSARPPVAFPSVERNNGSSSSSSSGTVGSRSTVKFTPNVAIKQETAAGATASPSAATGASGFSVDALLLRSLHSHQPATHGYDRLNRPKFSGAGKVRVPVPMPTMQSALLQANANTKQQKKKGPRSISLSDLATDESQGHLFLPITIPFKQQTQRRTQHEQPKQEVDEEGFSGYSQQQQQLDEMQGIDTAASTPNHLRRNESTAALPKSGIDSSQWFVRHDNQGDTPAAVLIKDRLSGGGHDGNWGEDERPLVLHLSPNDVRERQNPKEKGKQFQLLIFATQLAVIHGREFVHLCFPELLPPLDIAAMQAQQAEHQRQSQQKSGEQQTKASSSNSTTSATSASTPQKNSPIPLHALPSGRIGQLLIRRSGRVHLRLLTAKSRSRDARAGAEAAETGGGTAEAAAPDSKDSKTEDNDRKGAPQPPPTLHKDDICYDVVVGTEGSFAQEVGCLLSDTNEFIFLGRCLRKLIVTADVPRALAGLTSER